MATDLLPPPTLLTHIALPVRDLDATLAFYEKYTTLVNIHRAGRPGDRAAHRLAGQRAQTSAIDWLRPASSSC